MIIENCFRTLLNENHLGTHSENCTKFLAVEILAVGTKKVVAF